MIWRAPQMYWKADGEPFCPTCLGEMVPGPERRALERRLADLLGSVAFWLVTGRPELFSQ